MNHFLFAIIFFLPAGAGNVAPILAKHIPLLRRWKTPLDGGATYRGKRVLGPNKSWRGLLSGIVAGGLTGLVLYPLISDVSSAPEHFLIGATIGFGALLGDALESFFKRQRGVKSGDSWLLFDQLDYVIGALVFGALFVRLSLADYVAVVVFYFVGHLVMTYIGYLLGLKDKPI